MWKAKDNNQIGVNQDQGRSNTQEIFLHDDLHAQVLQNINMELNESETKYAVEDNFILVQDSDDEVTEQAIIKQHSDEERTDIIIKEDPADTDIDDSQNVTSVEVVVERIDEPDALNVAFKTEDGSNTVASKSKTPKKKRKQIREKTTSDKLTNCDVCEFKSKNNANLLRHMEMHQTKELGRTPDVFFCDHCNKRFFLKIHLVNHMPVHYRITEMDPYFTCSICKHTSASIQALRKHFTFHDKKRRYKCNICHYRFFEKWLLTEHVIKKHLGQSKRLSCNFCDFKTRYSAYLKKHIARHKGKAVEEFKCNLCNRKYQQKCHLNRHTKTHGEKKLSCDICNFKTHRNDILEIHLRTHTGEKPYKCVFCDFKSAQELNLRRHERTHTGEKPFECDICNFRCSQSNDLKKHKLKHTNKKRFKCEYCAFKTKFRMDLEGHIQKHHYFPKDDL